ncbi:MAG: methionine/alanine import NSS transporter subunit MetS [Corynebacterium sp.]|nr:methionine/alanine import NSS transporter subunit MetS [Corynebacterium sp.]
MSGIAIVMLVLFIVVIWGGLAVSTVHLVKHPDATSGQLGESPAATDEVLIGHED